MYSLFRFLLIIALYRNCISSDEFRDAICESGKDYLDGVVEYEYFRQFIIDNTFWEYDYDNQFRRRGDMFFEMQAYDRLANDMADEELILYGRFLSGFFIASIDCTSDSDPNVTACDTFAANLNDTLVVVIYDAVLTKTIVHSKKKDKLEPGVFRQIIKCMDSLDSTDTTQSATETQPNTDTDTDYQYNVSVPLPQYNGSVSVSVPVPQYNGSVSEAQNETEDEAEGETEALAVAEEEPVWRCGPYGAKGRVLATHWLLKGLLQNKKYKYLPMTFSEKSGTLFVVLNKEYELYGDNPSLIRDQAVLYWKSLLADQPSKDDWHESRLSNEYTYTAFYSDEGAMYLVGEPLRKKGITKRGPSYLFPFNMMTKEVIYKTDKSFADLFGCAFGSSDWLAYVVIGLLILILFIIIIVWIIACYFLYVRDGWTASKTSGQHSRPLNIQ